MAVIFPVWHPGAIAKLQGVSRLVLILIAVDVVLGPVMTLIIFSPSKPLRLLKLDLSIIAMLQLSALAYGLITIFLARPVYIVFNVDRFTIVTAAEIVEDSLDRAADPAYRSLPLGRPQVVAARLPEDPEARTDLMFASLDGGADVYQYPEHFVAYAEDATAAAARAQPLDDLKWRNDMTGDQWQDFLDSLGAPAPSLAFLPVEGNAREGVAIIHRSSGQLQGLHALFPVWP